MDERTIRGDRRRGGTLIADGVCLDCGAPLDAIWEPRKSPYTRDEPEGSTFTRRPGGGSTPPSGSMTPNPPYFDFRHLHGRTVVVLVCPPAVVHDYAPAEHEPVGLPLGSGSTWCGLAAQGGGR
jgi:hypothetical protein